MDTTCCDECVLFRVLTGRHSFFIIQTCRYLDVSCNRHVAALFKTSVLKYVRILNPLSPQKRYDAGNTIKVQNKASTS